MEIDVITPAGTTRVPQRTFHYTLLTLARARLEDADQIETERGWRYGPDLARSLGVDEALLSLHVFRARRLLGELGIGRPAGLVERRSGNRTLRIGVSRLEVAPL